jgi:hypothetical protein
LEGWNSTIELHPLVAISKLPYNHTTIRGACQEKKSTFLKKL